MSSRYSSKNLRLWRRATFDHAYSRLLFITKSAFEGSWDKSRQCMHGFGCYTYADGSTYHGYFKDGKYHGRGCLEMVAPYSAIINGIFENGHIVKIEDMRFCDELSMPKKFVDKTYDYSEWTYCTSEDRRFLWEIATGLKASGPDAMTTQQFKDRELKRGQYDIEEGLFNSTSGFIIERPLPFKSTVFVPCLENTVEWIENNCRGSREPGEVIEPNEKNCHKIIETNLNGRKWCNNNFGDQCTSGQKEGNKYFLKLYKMELENAKNIMKGINDESEMKPLNAERSLSCSSLSDVKIVDTTICEIPKHVHDDEASISMNMSNPILLGSLYGTKKIHEKEVAPRYFS